MAFFSFLGKTKKEDLIILDIASGSVGAAVVSFGTNKNGTDKKPRIDYVKRIPLSTKERVRAKTLETESLNAIKEIAADIAKRGMSANKIALVLSSPWYISHTKLVSIHKNEPFTVLSSFIGEIIEDETAQIQKEQEGDLQLVESSVANVKINGYSTLSPHGKTADNLDLSLYVSFAPISFLEKIEEKIEKSFFIKNISHHSFPFASLNTIQKIFHEDKNFLFVDIAGEITDIAALKDGAVVGSASFPVGINTLLRKVSDRFKINPDLAASFVKIFSEEKADQELTEQIGKLASAVKEEWLAYFYQVATDLYGDNTLSHRIFLTADDSVAGIASSFVKELSTSTVFLGDKALSEFCDIATHVQHDPFLTIESIYLSGL